MQLHCPRAHPLFVLTRRHFWHFQLQTVPKYLPPAALSVRYQRKFLPLRPVPSLSVQTLPHCPHLHRWPERPVLSAGQSLWQIGQTHQQHRQRAPPGAVTLPQPLQTTLSRLYSALLTVRPVRRVPDPSLPPGTALLCGLPFPQNVSSPPDEGPHPLAHRETHSGYPAYRSGPRKCHRPLREENLPATVTHCNNPAQPQCCSDRPLL